MKYLAVFWSILMSLSFMGQTFSDKPLRGRVVNAHNGAAIPHAMISVMGSKEIAYTDSLGAFEVLMTEGEDVLLVSCTGYVSKRMKVSSSPIYVELSPKEIDEVSRQERESDIGESSPAICLERPFSASRKSMEMNQSSIGTVAPNWNTEDYDFIAEHSFTSTDDQQVSTFSIDVDRASYANIRRFITAGTVPPKDAVRIEEMINYFDVQNKKTPVGDDHPLGIVSELGMAPWNPDHQLLYVGVHTAEIDLEDTPPAHLVFLIDVSGSMHAQNKLPLLISSFGLLVDQLRPQDKLSIVTYAGASGVLLEGQSGASKMEIREAISSLTAGGATAGAQGINTAYDLAQKYFIDGGNNRVILATDGDFNVGVSSDGALVRLIEEKRNTGVFLSVLGFGTGNYKDNKMQKLADAGNGNHNYIDGITEAKKVFVNEFGGTLFTVAKDVKIQVEFNPARVAGYRLIGYENRMLANSDFTDDKKDAGEIGMGHQVTALYEVIPVGVESKWLTTVEKRYDDKKSGINDGTANELCLIKLRYKSPDEDESKSMEKVVSSIENRMMRSLDFRWSSAVAGFGMILRDSEFRLGLDMPAVIKLARSSIGMDPYGYRSEFIFLMEAYQRIIGEKGEERVELK